MICIVLERGFDHIHDDERLIRHYHLKVPLHTTSARVELSFGPAFDHNYIHWLSQLDFCIRSSTRVHHIS